LKKRWGRATPGQNDQREGAEAQSDRANKRDAMFACSIADM